MFDHIGHFCDRVDELADKLKAAGIQYPGEPPADLVAFANNHNNGDLVIIFGQSDDLIEFRGAIDDEQGASEGSEHHINGYGLLRSDCPEGSECPYFMRELEKAVGIKANWCDPKRGASWSYTVSKGVHHSEFPIMENGEVYCYGIVVSLGQIDHLIKNPQAYQ